jgi:cytochrome c553
MESFLEQSRFKPLSGVIAIVGLIGLMAGNAAIAAGSAEAGEAKSVTCAACHGPVGSSQNPEWPNLAGQNERYLTKSLQAYKDGSRTNVLMSGQVVALTDEDIRDLAAFYAAQTPVNGIADPALVEKGERIYRGGNMDRGVSACIACHGPTGRGNPAAGYPRLAGQHAPYTAAQLRGYATKERKSDVAENQMMRNISALLTKDEIDAVASYIQGLQ